MNESGILKNVNYLSTVSGGGYIGTALTVGMSTNGGTFPFGKTGQDVGETPDTRHLRDNSRYLIQAGTKSVISALAVYLRGVVMQFGLVINTYERVDAIEKIAGGFSLTTHCNRGRRQYSVEKVVLATGGTARPRMLGVPGENLPHVSHYFRDPHEYFGKKLLIVGGKNSAVEAALRCHNAGAKVTLVHRREKLPEKSIKYWLLPEIVGLCEAGKIGACFESRVVEIGEGWVEVEKTNVDQSSSAPGPRTRKRHGLVRWWLGAHRASSNSSSSSSRPTGSGANTLWVRRVRIASSTSMWSALTP